MDKVILTTGGTGGHIFPALALAGAIREKYPRADILFMGSQYGPESGLAQKAGLRFVGLPVRGFLGRGPRAVPALFRLGWSLLRAIKELKDFKPDAIAGFGGYASFAPLFAARLQKVPMLLHEQNAIAGASNRFLSRYAEKICVSLPNTRGFAKEVVLTGNPVRQELVATGQKSRLFGAGRRLLVLGGSQGAHGINMFMAETAPALAGAGLEIWHQTGQKDLQSVRAAYERAGADNIRVEPFIDNMAEAYAWADMAFCRSGATTIAELCVMGLPSLLVPFPAAIHDHQTINAEILTRGGAARMIPENELDREKTAKLVLDSMADKMELEKMSLAARKLAKPDAARLLLRQLEQISNSKTE